MGDRKYRYSTTQRDDDDWQRDDDQRWRDSEAGSGRDYGRHSGGQHSGGQGGSGQSGYGRDEGRYGGGYESGGRYSGPSGYEQGGYGGAQGGWGMGSYGGGRSGGRGGAYGGAGQQGMYGAGGSGQDDRYGQGGYGNERGGYSSGGYGQNEYGYGGRDHERQGGYGGRQQGYGSGQSGGYGSPNERGLWDRTSDEVSSWIGDRDAERRRDMDQYRGRGPKNYSRSDDRLREDVSDRLSDDGMVDASDIEVQVSKGEVTLTGSVADRHQRRRAEDCAEAVSGVKHVQNNLRVKTSDDTSSSSTGSGKMSGVSKRSTGDWGT